MGLQQNLSVLGKHRASKGDAVEAAARSDVINALVGAVTGLAKGENIQTGVGIRKLNAPGSISFVVDARRRRSGIGSRPFAVTAGATSADTDALVTIGPGTVLGVMPEISGVKLDVSPPATPPTLAFNEDGIVCLRVNIDSVLTENFRPQITTIEVVKFDGSEIKDDDGDALGELRMIWDDVEIKSSGYFFIKVAVIKCLSNEDTGIPTISQINPLLDTVIYSFIILIDDVIILAP